MKIKASTRGLTFSFKENECFKVGTRYRYICDATNSEILIIPDENGKYKMSKKGVNEKPLLDLRNSEIKSLISEANYLEIEFLDDKIAIHIVKLSNTNIENLSDRELTDLLDKSEKTTIYTSKEALQQNNELLFDALKASGMFSAIIS